MKINQIKNVVLPLLLLFCLIGCSEDKEPQTYPPTLVTNSAAELTRFEALLSGSVVPHANSVAKAEVFFLFAKGNTLVDAEEFTATPDNTTEGRYVCTIDGLTPGNEYCYSICARSGGSIAKGEVIKFETLSSTAPVPATTIATNVNENGALLSSDITDNGGQNVTQRGFAYKVYQDFHNRRVEDSSTDMQHGHRYGFCRHAFCHRQHQRRLQADRIWFLLEY